MMSRFARGLDGLLQWILIVLMVALTAVVVVAVVYRRLGDSLSWYDEVSSILLAWVTYYGAALAALRRGHIGFDGVIYALPLPWRMWAVALGEVLVVGFFALMAWAGLEVLMVLEGTTLVSLTWVPVQFTQSVIPVGAALFIVAELASLPFYWRAVRDGVPVDHDALEAGRS